MNLNEYQTLASRTINKDLSREQIETHALHGLAGEVGELHSIYQKVYQGHEIDDIHVKKELGDILWFMAELCTAKGWRFNDIAIANIDKLVARYPEGFETRRSKHRVEGDI